jgi:hypothetical protein
LSVIRPETVLASDVPFKASWPLMVTLTS